MENPQIDQNFYVKLCHKLYAFSLTLFFSSKFSTSFPSRDSSMVWSFPPTQRFVCVIVFPDHKIYENWQMMTIYLEIFHKFVKEFKKKREQIKLFFCVFQLIIYLYIFFLNLVFSYFSLQTFLIILEIYLNLHRFSIKNVKIKSNKNEIKLIKRSRNFKFKE